MDKIKFLLFSFKSVTSFIVNSFFANGSGIVKAVWYSQVFSPGTDDVGANFIL